MNRNHLAVQIEIRDETERDRRRQRQQRDREPRRPRLPGLHERAVLTRAYHKAEQFQDMSAEAQNELLDKIRAQFAGEGDVVDAFVHHYFRELLRLGGNPYDLLAARHDGMTLDQYLAVPWPQPRYIKSF